MSNMAAIIESHKRKGAEKEQRTYLDKWTKTCNCRKKDLCSLDGACSQRYHMQDHCHFYIIEA